MPATLLGFTWVTAHMNCHSSRIAVCPLLYPTSGLVPSIPHFGKPFVCVSALNNQGFLKTYHRWSVPCDHYRLVLTCPARACSCLMKNSMPFLLSPHFTLYPPWWSSLLSLDPLTSHSSQFMPDVRPVGVNFISVDNCHHSISGSFALGLQTSGHSYLRVGFSVLQNEGWLLPHFPHP